MVEKAVAWTRLYHLDRRRTRNQHLDDCKTSILGCLRIVEDLYEAARVTSIILVIVRRHAHNAKKRAT